MRPVHTLIILLLLRAAMSKENSDIRRLPQHCSPRSYEVSLDILEETINGASDMFLGKVTIQLLCIDRTNYIALNAHHKFIKLYRIFVNDLQIEDEDYYIDSVTDILNIKLRPEVGPGNTYGLVIEYTGTVSTTDLFGLHRVTYRDKTSTKYYISTDFGSIGARRAFPCFDEPAFKATFILLVRFPIGYYALFNTKETTVEALDLEKTLSATFVKTPKMSTYVMGLILSKLPCDEDVSVGGVIMQVCSREHHRDRRDLAMEYALKILDYFSNFTNHGYTWNLPKLDLIALPELYDEATENWGVIKVRESLLVWDPNESDDRHKQNIVTTISRAIAQQWFGNLVTFKWFSDLFLKDGLATHLAYHVAQQIIPAWEFDKQFFIEEMRSALLLDVEDNHPLHNPVTVQQLESEFRIPSKKGACIMRMVHHMMQLENFKKGLQNYVNLFQHENADSKNFWSAMSQKMNRAFSKLPENLSTIMANWINEPGFPLLMVNLTGYEVTVSQTKFLLSPERDTVKWYVPITYTTSVHFSKFHHTAPMEWLTPSQDLRFTIPNNSDWVVLNNRMTGYYRVNYDDALWKKIKTALLRGNYDGIDELNRAQIVDDLFNLGRARKLKYSFILDILRFLRYDESYYSWRVALDGFKFLLKRAGENTELGKYIKKDIMQLLRGVYFHAPHTTMKDDEHIYTMKQMAITDWVCKLGDKRCIVTSRREFTNYRQSGRRPHRNIRRFIYCNALRYSKSSTDWYFLWKSYLNSSDMPWESINIRSALGCTRNKTLLRDYLIKSISTRSGFRDEHPLEAFRAVGEANVVGSEVVFNFIMENHRVIGNTFEQIDILGILIREVADRISTQSDIDRLRNFADTEGLTIAFRKSVLKAVDMAKKQLKWFDDIKEDLAGYYRTLFSDPTPPPKSDDKFKKFYIALVALIIAILVIVYLHSNMRNLERKLKKRYEAVLKRK